MNYYPKDESIIDLIQVLTPLVTIADCYDDNALDDEARKYWGLSLEHENTLDPKDIVLYSGRGGRKLLTLQDCLDARDALQKNSKVNE